MDKRPFRKAKLIYIYISALIEVTMVFRKCTTAINNLDLPKGRCFVAWQSMTLQKDTGYQQKATLHEVLCSCSTVCLQCYVN
jgi:hypothetical protein